MSRHVARMVAPALILFASGRVAVVAAGPDRPGPANVVRHARLDSSTPVFVPVHPRIATTVRFPNPVGEPMGTGFVEAEAFQQAAALGNGMADRTDYLISYEQGDPYFSVQPLRASDLLNLNVPYEGSTFVLYFYLVEDPLAAVASLVFTDGSAPGARAVPHQGTHDPEPARFVMERKETPAPSPYKPATPARLEGLLRKLRILHAAKRGSELEDAARSMKLGVALSTVEEASARSIRTPVTDSGMFELILLRAVRDPSLDAIGFILLMRNKADRALVFDLRSFSARCGAALYNARVVDAPGRLEPGELRPAYFVIVGAEDGRPAHLSAENDWRLSVAPIAPGADDPSDETGEAE